MQKNKNIVYIRKIPLKASGQFDVVLQENGSRKTPELIPEGAQQKRVIAREKESGHRPCQINHLIVCEFD